MDNRNQTIKQYIQPGRHVHLVGIGGVSMRPLGLVLQGMGLTVTGSDMNASVSTDELIAHGIHVEIGHRAENIEGADCIIRTAAAHNDNPEIQAARAAGIPIFERAQAWGVIMQAYKNAVCISGTHGKTSTTSMVTHILMEAGWDPTVMIGGVWHPDNKPYSGKTVAEISGDRSPGEAVCEILEKDLCRTGAFFFGMSEENLDRIYTMPWIVPGRDASLRAPWGPLGEDHPHPRAYGTMPEFFSRTTDASRGGALSPEAAVERMTSIPAKRFELKGRGVIEKGAYADLAIWDRDRFRNTATYENSHSFCTGMKKVFVNGALAYDCGVFTHSGTGLFLD